MNYLPPSVLDYPLVPGVNEPGDGTVVYVEGEAARVLRGRMNVNDFIDQWLADNARLCNCANCREVIVSKDERLRILQAIGTDSDKIPPVMGGRIKGRPYCINCLATHSPPGGYGDNLTPRQAAKLGKTA